MTTALFRTACLRASRHTANRQVIECRDRIGLRPQPHATGLETRVTMIEMELAVEPRLYMIAQRDDPDGVPLPELRCLDPRGSRRPTSFAPHGPRVSHDVLLYLVGPISPLERRRSSSRTASRSSCVLRAPG